MSETGKLKTIDFAQGWFEAGGKKYFIETPISTLRYRYYTLYQTELGYGVSFVDMLEEWKEVLNDANKLQFANICLRAQRMIEAVGNYGQRKHPALAICALFCNTEGEDRTKITEEMLNQKLKDFEEYDVFSFFALAATLVSGLTDAWNDTWNTDDLPTAEINRVNRHQKK